MFFVHTVGATVALLFSAAPVLAGVRSPEGCFPNEIPCGPRSTFLVSGYSNMAPCQFRFRADGGIDALTLTITLRDGFDLPVPACSISVTIEEGPNTLALCSCCPLTQGGVSGPDGEQQFVFDSLGGRGELVLVVWSHCHGDLFLWDEEIPFTSPDLNASCEPENSTTVLDLALWAGCFPPSPSCQTSDMNCSGATDIIDLGIFAGGLGVGCGDAPCQPTR
jgi:hypothetical protein